MAGRVIGKASIAVYADGTRARDDVTKTIERIERTARIKLGVELKTSEVLSAARDKIAEVNRLLDATKTRIKVGIDYVGGVDSDLRDHLAGVTAPSVKVPLQFAMKTSDVRDAVRTMQAQIDASNIHVAIPAQAATSSVNVDVRYVQSAGALRDTVRAMQAQVDASNLSVTIPAQTSASTLNVQVKVNGNASAVRDAIRAMQARVDAQHWHINVPVAPTTQHVNVQIRFSSSLAQLRAAVSGIQAQLTASGIKLEIPADLPAYARLNVPTHFTLKLEDLRAHIRAIQALVDFHDLHITIPVQTGQPHLPNVNPNNNNNNNNATGHVENAANWVKDHMPKPGDLAREVNRMFARVGQAAKIGLIVGGAALAGGGLAVLAGGLVSTTRQISRLAGAATVLPGVLVGAKLGAFALTNALSTIKDDVPDVVSAWDKIKVAMGQSFWHTAAGGMSDVRREMPELARGWTTLSAAMGRLTGNVLSSVIKAFGPGGLERMFGTVSAAVVILSHHTDALANGLVRVVQFGVARLPEIADALGKGADKLGDFATTKVTGGAFTQMLQGAKDTAKQVITLGGALAGLFRTFKGGDATGGPLGVITSGVQALTKALQSPAAQTGFRNFFHGAKAGIANLADTAGPALGKLVGSLGSTLGSVLPMIGTTLGTLAQAIATTLADPRVMAGVQSFFSGLSSGLLAIAPQLPRLAPVIALLLTNLGSIFSTLGPQIATMIPSLVQGLLQIIPQLASILQTVVSLLPIINPLLSNLGALVPVVVALASAFAIWRAGMFLSVLAANPMLLAVSAIVGGLTLLIMKSQGVRDALKGMWDFVKGLAQDAAGFVGGITGKLGSAFGMNTISTGPAAPTKPAGVQHAGGGGTTVNIYNPSRESASSSFARTQARSAAL